MKNNKIDKEWYCIDCYSDHHCINCPYMDELIYYNNYLLDIIDNKNNSFWNQKKNKWSVAICGCWNTKSLDYPICRECYYKSKL